eukprot:184091-Alexandrium_andersonii.AAC.1
MHSGACVRGSGKVETSRARTGTPSICQCQHCGPFGPRRAAYAWGLRLYRGPAIWRASALRPPNVLHDLGLRC